MKNRLLLTIGDPNSIAPEVASKSLAKLPEEVISRFIIIGEPASFDQYFSSPVFSACTFETIEPEDCSLEFRFSPGTPSAASGGMSFCFLRRAVELIKANHARHLVTAPVSKSLIVRSGIPGTGGFRGHTDYLAESFGAGEYSMMFYSRDMKVILVTIHHPLKDVPALITPAAIETALKNAVDFFRLIDQEKYNIAVCGLNPHAGEDGHLGCEDLSVIAPAVEKYKKLGYDIHGPLPADSVFHHARLGEYDMVVAMYHDQGLAPFKMLHFMDGVNVTLGLPFLRTSPDHGTAFDIAGKGIADESSMDNAIELLIKADTLWENKARR
ncbi:MAG: 4-hydroxythreonine-4-phosphate dehydrogenase PdxA [Spirochaetes bacterium GWF1_51_8]|nr:MAG: 4-hydroxythreonine-4-phosphate dehydrogenase PdxA [Spirochaetes bacterium GWF1_51_8]